MGQERKKDSIDLFNARDLETKVKYRLVTNLSKLGEGGISDEEVMEIYRCRWGIELLWKFLKMQLKLDHLITKNVNGITIQIYSTLIAYLILQKRRDSSSMGK